MIEQIATPFWSTNADVEALHSRCGVYTRDSVVCTLLDAVNWTPEFDLADKRILEPAAGDGAFVVEVASRLLDSIKSRGIEPSLPLLANRICAFEIHAVEAARARARTIDVLLAHGLSVLDAELVARTWIRVEDFLTADLDESSFTHVVGNPPYSRWSKIPAAMRTRYEAVLPRRMTHGDLFLPFLDLGIGYLQEGGRLGFVCTNRWRYMAFAEGFRQTRLPEVTVELDETISVNNAYVRNVDTYPSLLVLKRLSIIDTMSCHTEEERAFTLSDAGYKVRVGPALGVTSAFVLEPDESEVEEELMAPWVDGREICDGIVRYRGRKVISVFDANGKLRDMSNFPKAFARFEDFRSRLIERSIVKNGAVWYRSIDRILVSDWQRPKLLIPELSKTPRATLDVSGAVPSHGLYAIFAPNDDFSTLLPLLEDGELEKRLRKIAPKVKGNYVRCYKRFLERIPVA